jgi:nucleoside-diphosphate-sugar epimerase
MKIFLTGGTGFIGKEFIRKALKLGHFIYATSRKKFKNKKNLVWLKGDFDKNWIRQLKRSDVLVHMAAAGVNEKNLTFQESIDVNLLMSHNLLMNAVKAKCLKWIILGSASEYGATAAKGIKLDILSKEMPETNYELSKFFFSKLSFALAKKYNAKCRILRLFNVYGQGENKNRLWTSLLTAARKGRNFKIISSNQLKDFISINETVNIILDTINFKKRNKYFPQIWHVASGKKTAVKDFASYNWKINKAKGKLFFCKSNNTDKNHYISTNKSIWKIN